MNRNRNNQLPWWQTIRSRMVLTFCGLFSLMLLCIQLVQLYGLPFKSNSGAVRSMTAHQLEMLNAIADSRKDLLETWIRSRRRNARTIAGNPTIQQLAPVQGRLTVTPALLEWLDSIRNDYQLTAVRLLLPSSGEPVAALPVQTPAFSSRERTAVTANAGTDEQLLVTFDTASQSSRLHILLPVSPQGDPDKPPLLLLDLEADLDQLLDSTLNPHLASLLGKTGEVVLVDSQMRFLTHTKYPMRDGTMPIPLQTRNPDKAVELAVTGSEGTIAADDYRNIPVLAAYRHIQLTPDVSWGMVVKRDQKEIYADLNHQKQVYWVIALLGISLTVAISMLIATRLTRPLRKMVETAHTIEQGDLTARADTRSGGEVSELARSFNGMLDQLQAWHDELDYRVRQRTEQLVNANNDLQREISERIKTEEALHEKTDQLEQEIAERQKAQDELQLLNSSLAERIESAIAELRQKDNLLIHQSRLAAMGELLNSIAHQWRQPLNNIAAYVQNIQYLNKAGELTQEEIDQDIKAVMDILFYMSHTIDDFRSFFVKDRSKREFVLLEIVEKTLNLSKSALDDKNIKVSVEAAADVRAIGYPNEYAQTLMNILYNARDALLAQQTAEPEITITIWQEADCSVLTVQDNAGGIPPHVLPHIFEPYFTTKGPSQGTGIGLYMAKTMIEHNMGGRLTAGNIDNGAEFRIEL